jgi:N-carbamoyl-L-amino-acid hydrolase
MLSQTNAQPATTAFGSRIIALSERLAQWSESRDGLTCTYLSAPHRAVAAELCALMRNAGMTAKIDAVGNVVGRYPAADPAANTPPAARTLITASHYDTVVNAGKYDGRLGIVTPLVVIEHLHHTGQRLPYSLELIAFSEEEGVRFAAPYIGSSAVAGRFDMKLLERRDANGVALGDALRQAGFLPEAIPRLARPPQDLLGYIEVHIEQGPVLLQAGLPVGIVTSIAGAVRHLLTVRGVAGHAGTVPMALRRDAAAAAAEIVLAVEKRCRATSTLVGTVGRLAVPEGAINVIPGACELTLDIRAGDDATRDAAGADIFAEIEAIAERRGVTIEAQEIIDNAAVACAPRIQQLLAEAVARAGVRPLHLPSGAGHDAAMFDGCTDLGMLFVRCGNGGVSHSPRETVSAEDADLAARILLDVLLNFPSPP